ncbi:MAG: hypothetical protein AAF456_25205, partial [Planctomycetota bacterium]
AEAVEPDEARREASDILLNMSPHVVDDFYSASDYRQPYFYGGGNSLPAESRNFCEINFDTMKNHFVTGLIEEENTYLAIFEQLDFETEPGNNIDYKNRIHVVNGKW